MFKNLARKINSLQKHRIKKIGHQRKVVIFEIPSESKVPCRRFEVTIHTMTSYKIY